ncbi:glyceraldehyde 3-phosphate dehydrogenase NAD-binding domain-containing protein [Roseovarius sp. MBR-6]|uniref:type I glyceraldehyde-3-phosphate dehydrogenase n=1 Tax=Roseovarius sp. MBR-6 TaxID=3156459 RepID=UPI0033964612
MTTPPIRIAINGFGRIGRTVLRILMRDRPEFDLVCINEIEPLETCAYLFHYDSVFGPWPGTVGTRPGALVLDGREIPFHAARDLSTLDLAGVDLVLECTGMAGARAVAERGLAAGAAAVLVSGPSEEADITVVLGANEDALGDHRIISNASCTTNALAPLAKLLDETYGIVSGQMTTVHCYTGSQPTVDKPRGAPERSRAAALSMVPTTTSAQRLTGLVLPALAGRIEARAIRVPVASVSCIDLTVQTRDTVSAAAVNAMLRDAAGHRHWLGWTEAPLVSSDLRGRPESVILSGPQTSVSVGGLLRVFGWYDNEWGFSARLLDMAALIGQRGRAQPASA